MVAPARPFPITCIQLIHVTPATGPVNHATTTDAPTENYWTKRGAERRAAGLCASCNNEALPGETRCADRKALRSRRNAKPRCSVCDVKRKAMFERSGAVYCGKCVVDVLVADGVLEPLQPGPGSA